MRPAFVLPLLIVASFLSLSRALADSDSLSVGRDTPPGILTLHLERGDSIRVLYIAPRSDGMAAIHALDGKTEYIRLNRIQRVEDADGTDRTSELQRGKSVGDPAADSLMAVQRFSPPARAWKPFRQRAGPGSVCGSYMITDTALLWRMSGGDNGDYQRDKNEMVSLDYGYARNVGAAYSVGGTWFFLGDKGRVRSGVRARLVRWLSPDVSLDLGPGIVLLANEEGEAEFKGPGFSGQAGLTFFGVGGVIVEVTSVTRKNSPYTYFAPSATIHETMWHSGVRLSGVPGVGGTVALGILLVAALGSISSAL